MKPYGPGLAGKFAAKHLGGTVLPLQHFAHFPATERHHLGGGPVKRYGGIIQQIHSFAF